jgi:hypothetical protein
MIVDLVERWGGPDIVPTPEAFLSMLDENGKDALSMLAQQPVERTRQQIIEEILSLLISKNGGRDGKFDSYNLRSEEKRMASWTLDALRARLVEIKSKQKMNAAPVEVLKSIVREAHADRRKFPGYPNLPDMIVLPGQVQATKCDSVFLLNLARTDFYEYKRLCSRFSSDQITARQRGEI